MIAREELELELGIRTETRGDCWVVAHPKPKANGYVRLRRAGYMAHRLALVVDGRLEASRLKPGRGPSDSVDHLCRVRACVNPEHLEVVPMGVNTLRGEGPSSVNARRLECVAGHPLEGGNLRVDDRGKRVCRECKRLRSNDEYRRNNRVVYHREWRARRRAASCR